MLASGYWIFKGIFLILIQHQASSNQHLYDTSNAAILPP